MELSKVWYANPSRVESAFKFLTFDDRGALTIATDEIAFEGAKWARKIAIRDIVQVRLISQRVPWVTYALIDAAVLSMILALTLTGDFSPSSLVTLVIANIAGLAVGGATKWVAITYRDDARDMQTACFADASGVGWGGIWGGTREIYAAVEAAIGDAAAAPAPSLPH